MRLFFLNGGTDAYMMRIANGDKPSSVDLENEAGTPVLRLTAKNAGKLGDTTRVAVTYSADSSETTFNIEVFRWQTDSAGNKVKAAREEWKNLSMDPLLPTYAPTFLTQKSALVNALEIGAVATTNGLSLSSRPVEDDNNETGGTTSFGAECGTRCSATAASPAAPKHSFQISVDGNPFVEVTLHDPANPAQPPDVSALAGGSVAARETSVAKLIHDQILAALAAQGIALTPTNDVTVSIVDGPTGAALSNTRLILVTSQNGKDVRVASSGANQVTTSRARSCGALRTAGSRWGRTPRAAPRPPV